MKYNLCKYLIAIICSILTACSQTPESNEDHIDSISGHVTIADSAANISDFEVRAYAYKQGQWHDPAPVNRASISSNGAYAMNLPQGKYIFSLFNVRQKGPEFFYGFQNRLPCKTYELRLIDSDDQTTFANKTFSCEPDIVNVYLSGATISFNLENTGRVIGQITSQATGEPFSQVTIKAFLGNTVFAQSRPDAKGCYTICCLPEGDYHLKAEADNPQYVINYYENIYFEAEASPIEIHAQDDRKIDFQMQKGASITGTIKTQDNPSPIKDILVTAMTSSQNYIINEAVLSDANGQYTINGLPPDRYLLYADASNTIWRSCYHNVKYNKNDADVITVTGSGMIPDTKDFYLQEQGRLIVTINDKDGNSIVDNQISIKIYDSINASDPLKTIPLDNNGAIEVYLDEGKYYAEVTTDGTPYAPVFYSNENALQDATPIPVFNGKTNDTVIVKLQRGATIEGRVVGKDCNNSSRDFDLHNFTVMAFSKSNPIRKYHGLTDIYGEYKIRGLPDADDYVVQVLTDNSSYISEYYRQIYFFQDVAANIEVEQDQPAPKINFDLDCGREIYGHVTSYADNTPIKGITIQAKNILKNVTYSAVTASDGTYVISGMPSGHEYSIPTLYEYSVQADTKGQPFVSKVHEGLVQFEQSEKRREINFILKGKAKICGTFKCPSSEQTFDYCIDHIDPGSYDLILLDENGDEISNPQPFELLPGEEKNDAYTHFEL